MPSDIESAHIGRSMKFKIITNLLEILAIREELKKS